MHPSFTATTCLPFARLDSLCRSLSSFSVTVVYSMSCTRQIINCIELGVACPSHDWRNFRRQGDGITLWRILYRKDAWRCWLRIWSFHLLSVGYPSTHGWVGARSDFWCNIIPAFNAIIGPRTDGAYRLSLHTRRDILPCLSKLINEPVAVLLLGVWFSKSIL